MELVRQMLIWILKLKLPKLTKLCFFCQESAMKQLPSLKCIISEVTLNKNIDDYCN